MIWVGDISPREGPGETRYEVKCKNVQLLIFASRGRYGAYPLGPEGSPASPTTQDSHRDRSSGTRPINKTRTLELPTGSGPRTPYGAAQEML